MNNNNTDVQPLYSRITEFSIFGCLGACEGERLAICPECGTPVCVFCEDACEACQTQMW